MVGDGDHVPFVGRGIRVGGKQLLWVKAGRLDDFAIFRVYGYAIQFVVGRIGTEQFTRREMIASGNHRLQLLLQTRRDACGPVV